MSKLTWYDKGEKYNPIRRVAENYAKMMNDGQILSNRAAIDIIDSRVLALMDRIDLEEAPGRLKNLYAQFQDLTSARKAKDDTRVMEVMAIMENEFERAYHDYAAWEQMVMVLDLRRKMVDSEVKIIKEMKAFLSAEMAYKLVAKLLAVCIRLIKDPKLLRQINFEFSRIIGENNLRAPADVIEAEPDETEDE